VREVNRLLSDNAEGAPPSDEVLRRQAEAFKQALSLMIAQRRPSQHLLNNGESLARLTDSYLRLMAEAGVIAPSLRDAALQVTLQRQAGRPATPRPDFVERKGLNAVRGEVSALLGVPRAYDLERLDLEVDGSMDSEAQAIAAGALAALRTPAGAKAAGLYGHHLLDPGDDPRHLVYSFTLYERGAHANLPRIQADNIDQPFDVNQGARLDLGSTAKLRTLVSYLELVAELHERWAGRDASAIAAWTPSKRDPLGAWARDYLLRTRDRSLAAMLEAAMQRRYSAGEGEAFFTGGGLHSFSNFDRTRGGPMTVQEAFRHSVNLVFIRVMRDIVRHRMYGDEAAGRSMLEDPSDPGRREMLVFFADREGSAYLTRFYRKYAGKSPAEAERLLLKGSSKNCSRSASDAGPVRRARCARCTRPTRPSPWPIAATWRACIRWSSGWSATCGATPVQAWPRRWTQACRSGRTPTPGSSGHATRVRRIGASAS
jgi:hypothetical protein